MNVKISWYREVLELEPDSRLFYPLARLLAEEGELDEACAVLARGLERHPGYLEARLYYVELLRELHRTEESSRELELLAPVFARHSGFWQAWAATAATGGALDSALALRLMGLFVQGVQVDLSDLLRRGLDSLEAELKAGTLRTAPARSVEKPVEGPAAPSAVHPVAQALGTAKAGAVSAAPEPAMPNPLASIQAAAATLAAPAASVAAVPAASSRPAASAASEVSLGSAPSDAASDAGAILLQDRVDDEPAEALLAAESGTWPPRTRSMAEVLAEQGEYAEAMDIYDELLARCRSMKQRQELESRRRELEALAKGRSTAEAQAADDADEADEAEAGDAPASLSAEAATQADSAASSAARKAEASPLPGRELISMLETLADRVEARIR